MHIIMRRFHLHSSRLIQTPHLIRFRLTLWYTGLAALVLAVFVWVVFSAFSQYQQSVNDYTALLQTTFHQQVRVGLPPSYLQYRGGYPYSGAVLPTLQLKDPDATSKSPLPIAFFDPITGKTLNASPNQVFNTNTSKKAVAAAASKGKPNQAETANAPNGWRYITVPLSYANDTVVGQIAYPAAQDVRQVEALKQILVYVAGALLLISAAGGWVLSGRALKPVDEITRRARQITAHDLSQRLGIKQEDELGRMAATFDDMIGRLEEAFERQKRFASDASHELRTPLTVMQSEVSLALARPRSSDEYRETLVSMDEEVSRLSTIVSDLLTLTRVDVDPAGIQHKPVALDELLESLSARVGVIAAERDIAVRAERLDPVTVAGDSTRLRQLFTNLLDNAVNYTRDGGHVTVTVERTAEGARVRVADTGIGIAAADLPHIFERFYRADGARAQNAQGTGLGLAISRSVAQAHHGHIDVVSELGGGTTFTVILPSDSRKPVRRIVPWRVPALAR